MVVFCLRLWISALIEPTADLTAVLPALFAVPVCCGNTQPSTCDRQVIGNIQFRKYMMYPSNERESSRHRKPNLSCNCCQDSFFVLSW